MSFRGFALRRSFVRAPIHLSVYVCLSFVLSACLFPSVCPSVRLSVCLSVCLSFVLPACLFFFCLFVCLSVCRSVGLSGRVYFWSTTNHFFVYNLRNARSLRQPATLICAWFTWATFASLVALIAACDSFSPSTTMNARHLLLLMPSCTRA